MTTTAVTPTRTSSVVPAKALSNRFKRPSDFVCKQVMAVTGIVFGLFVLMHMLGNLK